MKVRAAGVSWLCSASLQIFYFMLLLIWGLPSKTLKGILQNTLTCRFRSRKKNVSRQKRTRRHPSSECLVKPSEASLWEDRINYLANVLFLIALPCYLLNSLFTVEKKRSMSGLCKFKETNHVICKLNYSTAKKNNQGICVGITASPLKFRDINLYFKKNKSTSLYLP